MRKKDVRICRVATYPRIGREGVGRASYELSQRITFPTLYITPKLKEKPISHAPHIVLKEVAVRDDVLPASFSDSRKRLLRLLRKGMAYGWFFAKSAAAMLKFRPTVVHIHSILPYFHGLFSKMLGAKVFVSFHGTDLYRIGRTPFLRFLLRIFDHVFYVSRAMEPLLEKALPIGKYTYTPNGVDASYFTPPERTREACLFSAGVLKWQKGFEILLEAFRALSKRRADLTLRIAGTGPCEDELKAIAEAFGISEKVVWTGNLNQAEMREEYRKAKCFVLASLSEGFPKVLLEAMACGTPVVATDAGSSPEILLGAGRVVSRDSPAGLARALEQVIEDETLWREMSARSRIRAEAFSWDIPASIVRSIILDSLGLSEPADDRPGVQETTEPDAAWLSTVEPGREQSA